MALPTDPGEIAAYCEALRADVTSPLGRLHIDQVESALLLMVNLEGKEDTIGAYVELAKIVATSTEKAIRSDKRQSDKILEELRQGKRKGDSLVDRARGLRKREAMH